jgi:hypothetical protein
MIAAPKSPLISFPSSQYHKEDSPMWPLMITVARTAATINWRYTRLNPTSLFGETVYEG